MARSMRTKYRPLEVSYRPKSPKTRNLGFLFLFIDEFYRPNQDLGDEMGEVSHSFYLRNAGLRMVRVVAVVVGGLV